WRPHTREAHEPMRNRTASDRGGNGRNQGYGSTHSFGHGSYAELCRPTVRRHSGGGDRDERSGRARIARAERPRAHVVSPHQDPPGYVASSGGHRLPVGRG